MVRTVQIRECGQLKQYLMLDGALVRMEDIRSLPRQWRLRLVQPQENAATTTRREVAHSRIASITSGGNDGQKDRNPSEG